MPETSDKWTWEDAQDRSFGRTDRLNEIGSHAVIIKKSEVSVNIEGEGPEPLLTYHMEDGTCYVEFFKSGFCLDVKKVPQS